MLRKFSFVIILFVSLVFARDASAAEKLKVILDWFPNIDHLPIYVALDKGWFAESGLEVEIMTPSDPSDPIKLAAAGQVDVAVSYVPQTLISQTEGLEIRAFGRLISSPLTCLFFLKDNGITKPSDLSGMKIGYTVPGLMDALLDAFASRNDVTDYEKIYVGYTIIPALVSGQVSAIMGPFKTYEKVGADHAGVASDFFELEKCGIPTYDELIFITGGEAWEKRAPQLRAFRDVIARAVTEIGEHPDESLTAYFKALPEADKAMETDAFWATAPFFARVQEPSREEWKAFADFALSSGMLAKPADINEIVRF